jgi:hypothetical protein
MASPSAVSVVLLHPMPEHRALNESGSLLSSAVVEPETENAHHVAYHLAILALHGVAPPLGRGWSISIAIVWLGKRAHCLKALQPESLLLSNNLRLTFLVYRLLGGRQSAPIMRMASVIFSAIIDFARRKSRQV